MPNLAINKRASFDYEILETMQAGLVLTGAEVKAIRDGQVSLKAAYITLSKGEPWLINAHISPYKKAGQMKGYEPTQNRKLLLKKSEINRLAGQKDQGRLTIIPLKLYTKHHLIKLQIGLGRGRKKFDKREVIKKRDINREVKRTLGDAGL
ncbi:MAG: SsrA-binding protein [Candidatus Magasanikbacteria bacterium GW2011_GWC2_41_17]|uniref:SsrA-binding protein n=1 Tax=Candidatus Magasanikbacteria bacterium GW2011_GWC2_41_17 TaxID=1619048 RepID=A0A0G0XMC1_9BACT|nr:MAG: SsrA-binding protein [Candidatus Magasanikbacteria bacterium GW2011_GWC2_41_17]